MGKVKTPQEKTVLSDKDMVQQLNKSAKLHTRKDKAEFVIEVDKKVIAVGSSETVCWKRALHSLL